MRQQQVMLVPSSQVQSMKSLNSHSQKQLSPGMPQKPQFYPLGKPQASSQAIRPQSHQQHYPQQQQQVRGGAQASHKQVQRPQQRQHEQQSRNTQLLISSSSQQSSQATLQKPQQSKKTYDLTVKLSEATLYVSKTKFFQMSVFVRLHMPGHEERKTSTQSGQNPKWDETFTFPDVARKSQMEFSVYHKSLFSNEELIGNAIFIFQDLYTYNLKKFITLYDNGQQVGGIHITLGVKGRHQKVKATKKQDDAPAEEEDANTVQDPYEEGGTEEAERLVIDQEIARQIVGGKGGSRNTQVNISHTMGDNRRGTENSMIQHYTNQSGNNSFEGDGYGQVMSEEGDRMGWGEGYHPDQKYYQQVARSNAKAQSRNDVYSRSGGAGVSRNQAQVQSRSHGLYGPQLTHYEDMYPYMHGAPPAPVPAQKAQQIQQLQMMQHMSRTFFKQGDRSMQQLPGTASKLTGGKTRGHLNQPSTNRKPVTHYAHPGVSGHGLTGQGLVVLGNGSGSDEDEGDVAASAMMVEDEEDIVAVPQETGELQENDEALMNMMAPDAYQRRLQQIDYQMAQQQQQLNLSHQQILNGLNKHQIGFDQLHPSATTPSYYQQPPQQQQQQYFFNPNLAGTPLSQNPQSHHSYLVLQNPQFSSTATTTTNPYPNFFDFQPRKSSQPFLHDEDAGDASPLLMTPSNGGNHQVAASGYQQDLRALETLRNELREENERIKAQEGRLKKVFDKYQHDAHKLQKEKQEVRTMREQVKAEQAKLQSQREEMEYKRQQMERGYVNLKREKSLIQEQVSVLEEVHGKMAGYLKDSKQMRGNDGRKIDEILQYLQLTQINLANLVRLNQQQMSQHLQQESTSSYEGGGTNSQTNGQPNNMLLDNIPHFNFILGAPTSNQGQFQGASGKSGQQSPPKKVITDVINSEDEFVSNNGEVEVARGQRQQRVGLKNYLQQNSEQHELSTIMEREQLTNSQRRSSYDMNHIQRQVATNQQQHYLGLSSDNINPDEEATNMFVTNQPVVVAQKRPHPLTTTNKQFMKGGGILIPTTPTTNHAGYEHQIAKERQQLDQERQEYEDRKNQLEGLYQQLHKELEDIQILKQAYTQIGVAAAAASNNASMMSHTNQNLHASAYQTNHQFNSNHVLFAGIPPPSSGPQNQDLTLQESPQQPKQFTQQDSQLASAIKINPTIMEEVKQAAAVIQQQVEEEDSMTFTPDPDFLMKINQNMLKNDRNFGPMGQPPSQQMQQEMTIQQYQDPDFPEDDDPNYNQLIMQQPPEYAQQPPFIGVGQAYANMDDYGYEGEDPNQLVMSNSDIFLMFGSAAGNQGNPGMLLIPNSDGGQFITEGTDASQLRVGIHQQNHNSSTQGQGDRKIEYIQDDFNEELEIYHGEQQIPYDQEEAYEVPQHNMLDDPDDLMDQASLLIPHQGENKAHDMYGTIKREDTGADSSKLSHQHDQLRNSHQQNSSDDVIPLDLIIKGKREKLTDEEIQKLIDENYHQIEESSGVGLAKDHNMIFYNGKLYDEKKRAVYGIQKSKQQF